MLLNLPNELVVLIAGFLDDEYCINALLQTCRRLFSLLNCSLYQHNVHYSHACSLEWVARKGFEGTVRHALKAGAHPNVVRNQGWLPMALACIHGHEAVVQLLLDHGVNPDVPDSTEGWIHYDDDWFEPGDSNDGCPMVLAAGRGHEHVVRLLLSHGASPDIRCTSLRNSEITPLSSAAKNGHLSIVKLFVHLGCDIHTPGWLASTILTGAASGGHSEVVRYVLETRDIDSPPVDYFPALARAASQGHLEIVDLLLKHSMNQRPRMEVPLTPFVEAAVGKHYAVIETLLRFMDLEVVIARGEPDDHDHKQLLMVSAACSRVDLAEKLLERGCSTDVAVPWVLKMNHPELQWKQRRIPPSPLELLFFILEYPSPLALAAHRGHHGVVKLLLNRNADLHGLQNLGQNKEETPLSLAIDGNNERIVNTLLDHGADPNY